MIILNPKISVIVPAYNAEKFLRQCLISILSSKFADYEVIVVDDCSIDNTVAEAEKLLPYFEGRLKIISTEKNSGSASVPRNLGIKSAAGKYLTFVDNDDMIFPTALGNFFEAAEKFSADVIHTEKNFVFNDDGEGKFRQEDLVLQFDDLIEKFTEVATPETKNFDKKIQRYLEKKFFWLPWGKFYRRNFLLKNKIEFPQIKFSEDMIFCFKCLCLAENYIRVPFATNIHRFRKNSGSKYSISTDEGTRDWLKVVLKILEDLENFIGTQKKFSKDNRYKVLKFFIDTHLKFLQKFFSGIAPHEVNKIFFTELSKHEFEKFSRGKNILLAYFCTEKFV